MRGTVTHFAYKQKIVDQQSFFHTAGGYGIRFKNKATD